MYVDQNDVYKVVHTVVLMGGRLCRGAKERNHGRAWRGFKYLLRREVAHFTEDLFSTDHIDKCKGLVRSECCGFTCTTSSIHMLK